MIELRRKPKRLELPQKVKRKLTTFIRPEHWKLIEEIANIEETYYADIIDVLLDLGLKAYYGVDESRLSTEREIDDDTAPWLYD
jgi:hypothetical protein